MNYTVKEITGASDAEAEIDSHANALEIAKVLNSANDGMVWVIQQNV